MNILVLNGSPSGEDSITLCTARYIEKLHPEHHFQELAVGRHIKAYERDFSECRARLAEADLILFCYPVYTFLVPAQLHRFVELMKESGLDFSGKYATQITTSKHFYDVTAHRFIQDNCDDLGLRYLDGLSADMDDLLAKKGQKEAADFFQFILWQMGGVALPAKAASRETGKRIVIVTDSGGGSEALQHLIDSFRAACHCQTTVADLAAFPFAGGCLGCFRCAASGECVYKDGFSTYLREHIQTAAAVVYAFRVKDHSMGYRFKLFDDRQFCNGHRTVTMGSPVGYLIDGDLREEPNLRMLIEARAQVGGNYLAGVAESCRDGEAEARQLADTLWYAIENDYQPPANFYGVGGLKIFRDLIYQMRGMMREDHRFYKKNGFYDFPQKKKGRIVGMYLVGAMMKNEKLQKKIGGRMTEGMIMPYKSVLKKAERQARRNKQK